MIVYHGTSSRRARQICAVGFLPKKPSRRVWFAESRRYALGRAKTQARRTRDRAVVLTCDIDVGMFRNRFGSKRVFHRNRVIAIDAPVPVSVLRSAPGAVDQPSSPEEIAEWVNELLRLKPYKGAGPRHPGVQRLSAWVAKRVAGQPRNRIPPTELLQLARRWLPELFDGVEIDPEGLEVHRKADTIDVAVDTTVPQADPREDQAIELLEDPSPKHRVRGLALLARLEDPDLFEWCAMCLGDDSIDVRLAALHTMRQCEDGDPELVTPFAESSDQRMRGAAISALARLSGEDAPRWFRRGLRDPSPCVRVETAAVLSELDPEQHRDVFSLALYDPNPEVVRRAEKVTQGRGFEKAVW